MSVSELKRLKDLEAENAKLKRMYADLALENSNHPVSVLALFQGHPSVVFHGVPVRGSRVL